MIKMKGESMNKYLIVSDTTSALDAKLAEQYDIELVSLSVIIDKQEYKDQINITTNQLYDQLREGKIPTTSQPNQAYVQELMQQWKKENYDAIFIITCSSDLSGTYNGFNLAKDTVGMDNLYIIDSRQVGSPIMDMAIHAKELANNGASIDEIINAIKYKTDNSFSFLYPANFTQLKKGGRLSPAAANIASMLKIQALLYLKEDGSCVEMFSLSRSESKIIQTIVNKFKELHVLANTHKIYLAHADNLKRAEKIKARLNEEFQGIEFIISALPAVLTCHGGLGCVSIHSIIK